MASNWGDEHERVKRLGKLTSLSLFAGIGGGLLLSLHDFLPISHLKSYRILYLVSSLLLFSSTISIIKVKERDRPKKSTRFMRRSSLRYILKVSISNAVTGAGIGITIPLLPLWYSIVFHSTLFQIGLIYTASSIATALGSITASRIRYNTLKLASLTRILNGIFLIGMAFSPFLLSASALYVIRNFNAGLGMPNRSTVNVRGLSEEDLGTGSSIQAMATRLAQMSSGARGYIMELGPSLPLMLGGVLQSLGGLIYFYY